MSYASNQDIIDRVGTQAASQLTTDSGGTPSQAVLDEIRTSSQGEVDGYLSKRYAVPVDVAAHPNVEGLLKGITLDVAVYRLKTRRPPIPDADKTLYEKAIELLEKIAKGDVNLPAVTTLESTAADAPLIQTGFDEPRID